MNQKSFLVRNWRGLLPGALVSSVLLNAACVYADPNRPVVYRDPAPAVVVAQDDYVYYPQYEVYYSASRHQYGYRDGNSWAWRPAPPHVSLNVLVASPSVHMDFHDSPEKHHSDVVRSYPKNWKPPAPRRDDHHDDDHKH
jgi:hypothetical protein